MFRPVHFLEKITSTDVIYRDGFLRKHAPSTMYCNSRHIRSMHSKYIIRTLVDFVSGMIYHNVFRSLSSNCYALEIITQNYYILCYMKPKRPKKLFIVKTLKFYKEGMLSIYSKFYWHIDLFQLKTP